MVLAVAALAFLLAGIRIVGFTPYAVLSGSMEPAFHVGSLIYVKSVDPEDIKVGDAITFRLSGEDTAATHRVIEIDREKSAGADPKLDRQMVRAAFSSRRKTLCNNLMRAFSLKREEAEKLLSLCGVSPNARGETLSAEQFKLLAKAYGEKVWKD